MWLVLRLFTSERRDFGVGRVPVDALTWSDVEGMAGSAIPGKSSEFPGGDVTVYEGHGARSALLLAMSLLGNTPLYMSVAVSAQEDRMSFETAGLGFYYMILDTLYVPCIKIVGCMVFAT